MRVHACITHYVEEVREPGGNPIGNGSLAPGARMQRTLALSRCIYGLLATQRHREMVLLNIHQKKFQHFPTSYTPLELCITICSDGEHQLDDVLNHFQNMPGENIKIKKLTPENPRDLGLACRDYLIDQRERADLLMYLEDDLVIHDKFFFDKQNWFLEKTGHRYCLMPHRFEAINAADMHHLIVDGPLDPEYLQKFQEPKKHAAQGMYQGQKQIFFDLASNPHSGCFVISYQQADEISKKGLPKEGFVGPLETAATFTVLEHYPVMKPSLENWDFLNIEHAHHSFSGYISTFPHESLSHHTYSTSKQLKKK